MIYTVKFTVYILPMTRKALTPQEVDDFRKTYCEKAYALYKEQDYHAISIRGIAREMGCSPMTAYRYFENKDAVFAHLRAILFHRLADTLDAVPRSPSPVKHLKSLSMAYAKFAQQEPHAYRLLYLIQVHPDDHQAGVDEAQARTKKVLFNATLGVIKSGRLKGSPVTVAHAIWGLIHGLVSLELANNLNQGASLEELLPEVLDNFLLKEPE
jgi:AcrR family transcriptional regulator